MIRRKNFLTFFSFEVKKKLCLFSHTHTLNLGLMRTFSLEKQYMPVLRNSYIWKWIETPIHLCVCVQIQPQLKFIWVHFQLTKPFGFYTEYICRSDIPILIDGSLPYGIFAFDEMKVNRNDCVLLQARILNEISQTIPLANDTLLYPLLFICNEIVQSKWDHHPVRNWNHSIILSSICSFMQKHIIIILF